MNYGEEESQLSNTSMSLRVSVLFWLAESQEGSWKLKVMKEFLWDNLQIEKHIEYSITEPR